MNAKPKAQLGFYRDQGHVLPGNIFDINFLESPFPEVLSHSEKKPDLLYLHKTVETQA